MHDRNECKGFVSGRFVTWQVRQQEELLTVKVRLRQECVIMQCLYNLPMGGMEKELNEMVMVMVEMDAYWR